MLFDEHKDNSDQNDPNNPYNIEGQGKQIGYEDYLQYKQDFNDSRTLSYSSSDLYKKRIRERDAALLDSAFWATTAVGAGTLLYHQANRSDSIRYLLQEAPMASLARHKLTKQFQDNKAAGLIAGAIDPRLGHSPQTVGASLHSMLLGLEELSPMQLMKTLQLSSFSSLFVEIVDAQHEQARHIKGSSIANYGDYYKNMIKKEAGIDLSADDLNRGFILEKGKLYKALPGTTEGQVVRGDKLLDHARIVATGIKTGEDAISTNRVFEKLANGYGVNIKRHMIDAEPLAIVGANSKEGLISNWTRAYGRFSVELGARSLDNPLGFIEEYINMSGGGSRIFNSKAYQTLKKYSNIQLGSGGVYNTTTRDMLTRTGKNLAVKGAALTVGLNLADVVVENIAPENSAWANGIISGLADTAMKTHIKFAEIWSDNFQAIKKAQEFAAPGSTELTSLLGITLAGTMAGANAAYVHRMYDNTRLGVDESSAKHLQERRIGGKLGEALDKIGKNKPTTTLGRYSKVGTLAGAALALPFLPGALVGKSSDELRAEYSGEKEVAVKSTRYWLSGAGDYRGGKVEYHRDHLLKVLATDAETKTLYGDRETKRSLNPVLKPFAYLSNPYRFEEMHTHDAPMPVWGMDTSYGSFLGQMFRGTAGQIIKPTVVHPELEKQQNAILEGQATLSLRGNLTNLAKAVEKGLQKEVHNKQAKGSSSNLTADQHYLPWLATEQEMTYGQGVNLDSETYTTPEQEKKDVKSLIEDGMMLRRNAPTNEPYFRSFQGAYSGAEEFVGLKGFASGLTIGLSGAHPVDQLRPELEISGSTTNASKAIQNLALGDAMGCFLPGTPVLTKNGYKPIEEITEKDKVISLNGVPRKVREAYYMLQTDIEVLRVYVEGLPLPINCTPDHRFPSILQSNIAIDDREIGSLKEGDFLLQLNEDFKEKRSKWDLLPRRDLKEGVYRLSKIIRIERTLYSGPVYDLGVYVTPYYTVSGILCHNSGEFLRRLFPQSASARRETINPMRNLVAPEWLPSNDTKYYKNFSRGAVWSHNEMGEVLTPGTKGFETLNPELKNVDPNEIPLVYQYKVLQNIANKSPEHLAIKEHLVRNLDKLSQKEKDVFFEAYGQDEAKERLKEFNEYAEDGEKSRMGLFAVHNAIWETVAHKENPLEPLLPFRPMAKFVHQRTAIEDYEKTQMMGPDTGIWTNPFSHFIKPAANRVVKNAHGGFVPEEYEEKNRVDQYFDKLALIKADKNGNTYEKERNLTALAYTGVRNAEDMRKFKMALSTEQRAYVESFSREKDQEKRQKILQMVPNDIGRIYQSVWKNIDNYDIAVKKGLDPKAYLDELYLKETGKMASITKVELSREEKQAIKDKEYADKTFLEERKLKKMEEAKALRLKAATKEAYKYVERQTGKVPGENWVGWDPRLTVDDIKLKTLLVGREDIHKYGYWNTDVERIERLVALDRDNQITDDLEKIKRELRAQSQNQITLANKLRNAGFEVSRVNTSPASKSSLTIKETEEYLNDYYQK